MSRIIYVDIDYTICDYDPDAREYPLARPLYDRIAKINQLYDEGNEIVYWTARGTVTGLDWRQLTESQFEEWGVKYHDLMFGKPAYDLFIDDKNINSETFFENQEKK